VDDRSQIVEVVCRYLLAVDNRDGDAARGLFSDHSTIEISVYNGETHQRQIKVMGEEFVGYIIGHLLPGHAVGELCRHMSSDHIVEVEGDTASIRANFLVIASSATADGDIGRTGTAVQNNARVVQSGFLTTSLIKSNCMWRINRHCVFNDLPGQGIPLAPGTRQAPISPARASPPGSQDE
jgi:hypothetical protein